jgi:CubicO group peptidase (beta-lactamase class C family)
MLAEMPAIMGAVSLNRELGTGPWVRSLLDINCYAAARTGAREENAIQLELQGDVDAAFEEVAEVFLSGFSEGRDVGAALGVVVDGELVVDVWAGHTDRKKTQLWSEDTLCCLFSATKGIATICVLQAVAEDLLELDEPLAAAWPEFARNGKEAITLRHVLCHRAGLVGLHEPVESELIYDWNGFCSALADDEPWWTPGELHGYHARTFGFLLGELLRRKTGRTIGEWLKERLAGPHALDLHIGLNNGDLPRCAQMVPARIRAGQNALPDGAQAMMLAMQDKSSPTGAAFQNPSMGPGYMNTEQFRRAELPAMNGHGVARDLARLYALLPDLLPEPLLREATRVHSSGPDQVLLTHSQFGLGFMLHDEAAPIGVRPGTFGHAGAGGSMAFYDPTKKIGFCFAMNQMQAGVVTGGVSAMRCAGAVYEGSL